ncbi:MAG: Type III restriction-modification system methylation subunit [Rhodanobacteraceae bacterium]|jgi:DNA modification methylase|nr:MAG: Type III restriction-modification system methylation subunit [Rhodanobacteraceae bacterium]
MKTRGTEIALPEQEQFFSTEKLRRSARAGTQLPDPTMAPYGYDPKARFNHLFPALELPALFPPGRLHPDDHVSFGSPELPPHQLYLGDNLYVLRGLPSESIDLIYIDPPFFSNRTYTQIWGDDNEVRSFGDIFQDGMFSYLAWLNARLWEMKRVLKSTGSIYVHCDWHASHYIKCEMDKIFGYGNFVNEVVWHYNRWTAASRTFQRMHDSIFWYAKGADWIYNMQFKDYAEGSKRAHEERGYIQRGSFISKPNPKGVAADDVWDFNFAARSSERIGYPTQKPEFIVERILCASSNGDNVVADFFMGGGTTGAVAMKLGRRFIGCDISRVAVSVTASRMIEVGEQLSGVTVTARTDPTLGLKSKEKEIADIRIGYVGSYPMEKFRGIGHDEFVKFILALYGAMPITTQTQFIHGTANNKLVLSVGSGNPEERVGLVQVEGAVKETLRQYKTQFSEGEEKILQIFGWSFDPAVDGWRRKTIKVLNEREVPLQVELVSLASEGFRQKIFRNVGESNIDLKFNRLNQLLSFTGAPFAGQIAARAQSGLTVTFVLEGARAMGAGGKLINCQWDFNYDGARFAQREYALNRTGSNGNFDAVLEAEYTFPHAGEYTVAARVQDNLDGQATAVAMIKVANGRCEVKPVGSEG